MSSAGPGATSLKTWQEAFNYPIATTRQIEKQLQNDIRANKERLRMLVGTSYRDLLGTADEIVQLNERMQETEKLLADVSLQCNVDIIDKKARKLAQLQEQFAQQKSSGRQLAAQLTLLQNCQRCLPRLFRRGSSVLIAAKVLAVSRLLNKSIAQRDDTPPILESIRRQLSSHRRRLLSKIDSILTGPGSSFEQLIEAVCAFCIATSSSSGDAIRHFHQLRLDEIRRLSSTSEQGLDDLLAGFEYYLRSLRTTKQLLGRQLSDVLRNLRSKPILRSPDIESLDDLSITDVQKFIPTEILSFVPWVKHQDSAENGALSVLEKWSNIAFQAFYQGLKGATDGLSDISELLDYRNKLLQTWLPVSVSTPTHSAPEVFEALRNVFNARLKDLLHDKASSLAAIASRIEMALEKDDPSTLVSFLSIWDQDFVTMPLGRGASSYKKQLIDRHLGQSKTTNNILSSLQKWTTTMFTSLERIQQLRKTRWIDLIEDDEDEDDDNSRIERIETTLQKVDPDQYEQEHSSSLRSATLKIQNKIKQVAENLPQNPNDEQVRKPIFLLRTFRAIHQHLATAFPQQDLAILNSAVLHLHRQLASNSATRLLDTIKPSTFGLKNQQIKHLTRLWSGEPTPLPTQPSPPILKCLYRLTGVMAEQGPDLWSTDAVDDVKRAVRNGLVNIELLRLTEAADLVNGNSNTITNGNGKDNTQTDDNNDGKHITDQGDRSIQTQTQIQIQIQNLFDLLYLSHALRIDSKSPAHSANTAMNADEDDPLTSLLRQSKHSLSAVSESTTLEIEARAKEYWARTRLLFGLLD